jgi:uncharacterized protein YjbI with pentapeptide repeats
MNSEPLSKKEVAKIRHLHELWLRGDVGGARAIQRRDNFGSADLRYSNLTEADFAFSDLVNARLSYANLRRSDFSLSNLRGADLSHSVLKHANLAEADLSGANLAHADLSFADLSDVIIDESTIFSGANLTGARGIPGCLRSNSKALSRAKVKPSSPLR